jgi:hypothetical protein
VDLAHSPHGPARISHLGAIMITELTLFVTGIGLISAGAVVRMIRNRLSHAPARATISDPMRRRPVAPPSRSSLAG